MPILPIRLEAVAHIPHGSGDAEYHLIDADADNSDVMAIIDPSMILDDPAGLAERLALAANSHDALVAALDAVMACARGEIERPVTQRSGWPNAERLIKSALALARGGVAEKTEHGYDITNFGTAWPAFQAELGLRPDGREPNSVAGFRWINDAGLLVVTGNNPVTGQYRDAAQREPQIGFASYMGAEGPAQEVERFRTAVRRHAVYIKGSSERRSYI